LIRTWDLPILAVPLRESAEFARRPFEGTDEQDERLTQFETIRR
jgi:hypothetical protein